MPDVTITLELTVEEVQALLYPPADSACLWAEGRARAKLRESVRGLLKPCPTPYSEAFLAAARGSRSGLPHFLDCAGGCKGTGEVAA